MTDRNKKLVITIFILLLGNFFVWQSTATRTVIKTEYYFLDVGQGDSELLYLPDGIKVLIDAGNNDGAVVRELEKILPMNDRYIDIAVMTHPQRDHSGGIINLLDSYEFGLLIDNGREGTTKTYDLLREKIKSKKVKTISVTAGDRILYGDIVMNVLNPTKRSRQAKELNDGCIVLLVEDRTTRSLFTCDIGTGIENVLRSTYDIHAQILKVPHHGSRFSSSKAFITAVKPIIAVIEVGDRNSYGHPTKETLAQLSAVGATILRTDKNGTMRVSVENNKLYVSQIDLLPNKLLMDF